MARTVKNILLALIALLAVLVAYRVITAPKNVEDPVLPAPPEKTPEFEGPGPFDDIGVRFDGHYRCERGSLRYLLRFYPEGRVVLITGTQEVESTLPKFLTRDTQGNTRMGLHNVMATTRNDSIFFVTHPDRGDIEYKGAITGEGMMRFLRHSHINGTDVVLNYLFRSDAEQTLLDQQGGEVKEVTDPVGGQ